MRPLPPTDDAEPCDLDGAARALERSEAVMRTLIESASEGIVIVDRKGRVVLVNARAEEMFGYRRDELLGQPIGLLLPERFREVHLGHCGGYFRHPQRRPMGAAPEFRARRRDGSEFPVEVSLSFAEAGGERYAMSFVSDVSERVQAEEALQAYSQRLEQMVEERTRELRQAQAQLLAQQRLQRDLELAQQVQASLLPRQVPTLEGYQCAAEARPARYVSGDLYDLFHSGEGICHLVLADIAGKGVPAALLTSTARTFVRAEAEHDDSPAAILASVNRALCDELAHAEVFITMLVTRLDARLGRLTYASAGHTEVLWWQGARRTQRLLPATGLPLGIANGHLSADTTLTETTVALRPGDTLVFYSDGVTEAANPDGELFGLRRLADILPQGGDRPASDLAQAIVDAVEAFRAGEPLSDDLTLIVLKALPRSVPFSCPATLEHLDGAVTLIRQIALPYGEDFAYQMELASSEIVSNVMRHACGFQGEVRGQITVRPEGMQVDLYDDGVTCDLDSLPAPELGELREGGYGLYVARQLIDELSYTPATPEGNHWRLVKRAQKGSTDHAMA